jgi:hypothetical protein
MRVAVTINAMPGTFQKLRESIVPVFNKTSNIKISSIHDVYGFCDLICELDFEGKTEDIYDDICTRLTSIPEVKRTNTHIVIHKSPPEKSFRNPITGYVFISAIPELIKATQEELIKLSHVISCEIISGEYDILVRTDIPIHLLEEFSLQIQSAKGFRSSDTCIPHDVFRFLQQKMVDEKTT